MANTKRERHERDERITAAITTGLNAAAGLSMTKPADVALCILSALEQDGLRITAKGTR